MSILFILVILILIAIFTISIFRKGSKSLFIPAKLRRYLVAAYCIILLISTFVLYLIPQNGFADDTKTDYKILNSDVMNFPTKLASEDRLNSSWGYTKKGSWSFYYSGKAIKIDDSTDYNIQLIGERKAIDDGKIEITEYVVNSTIDGVNVTHKINPSSVNLNKDVLTINKTNSQINIDKFDTDFTAAQFIKNTSYSNYGMFSPFFNMRIMYIKIPKDLKIDNAASIGLYIDK